MSQLTELQSQREASIQATKQGPPPRTSNQFFGVGPITNMTLDEVERRMYRFQFDAWLEKTYRKLDDRGQSIGPLTTGEMDRGMHRGYPADKVVLDMAQSIHRYFGFPLKNRMAVGLGGGHNGFTVSVLHMMNPNNPEQCIFVDTPKPETETAQAGGFFRQSWATQILELQHFAENGDETRVFFSETEGYIPTAQQLTSMGIKLFMGVGHETTGATTYCEEDVRNLLEWIDLDPKSHHAILDGTSMLGAMPWSEELVRQVLDKCCLFMPFQKAIGGTSGYFLASYTPEAIELIEYNVNHPAWAIPRHLKIAIPKDPKRPLSSEKTTTLGPIYDPKQNKMLGGIINTFSILAFAETTYNLICTEKRIGSAHDLNKRSAKNRQIVADWVAKHPLFELAVTDEKRRGAAVTLLKVNDPGMLDSEAHAKVISKAKQLLSYEGLTHPNGEHERGLDVARYVNAFSGSPGDFRAWIGGARPESDIVALLDNIEYAYHRAKIVVLEEKLAEAGVVIETPTNHQNKIRKDDPNRTYKVLIVDPVGLKFDESGNQDIEEVRTHIESQGGVFHEEPINFDEILETGKIHFFYQPDLSTESEILPQTNQGQYDAVIAAATFLPSEAVFSEGGVRIGAGTGNMKSLSWGGGSGAGGDAPLMNTPSFNSRATAQMAFKALLKIAPDLPVETLHQRVVEGDFDTGKNLKEFPTETIAGKRLAVLGYGNIGREVAKIAKAFAMEVVIYARPKHQQWIESEGFQYAATLQEAASQADFISPHLGLGSQDSQTGKFANEGIINETILEALNDGAVVVNYDRGEVVDAQALGKALKNGKVRYVCVDADIFKNAETGEITGPLAPYRELEKHYSGRLELLPHAAADTEHVARVEGSKQAVNQIMQAIQYKEVVNLKGDLPEGYQNAGAKTVSGVGAVSRARLRDAMTNKEFIETIRQTTEQLTAFWEAVSTVASPDRQEELIDRYGEQTILNSNRYNHLIESLGLHGPYKN